MKPLAQEFNDPRFARAFTPTWMRRFMEAAELRASWSKDPSTKVGAVIVSLRRQEVGYGYNGFPPGVEDSSDRLNDRETKYAMTLHAEENALLSADFIQARPEECLMFVTHVPCSNCMAKIIRRGLAGVVAKQHAANWAGLSADLTATMSQEANCPVLLLDEEEPRHE